MSRTRERIEALASQLRAFTGYRTLWVGGDGGVLHTEPDVEDAPDGYRYAGTLMQPDEDELDAVLTGAFA